jgi:hypothetical protein
MLKTYKNPATFQSIKEFNLKDPHRMNVTGMTQDICKPRERKCHIQHVNQINLWL